jgi:flagellar protein FlbT
MALKVELKPHERIILGQVVIRNGDTRAKLFVEGRAPILREKDILTAATASTPARMIYLCVQLMYLTGDVPAHKGAYFALVRDFLAAAPSATAHVDDINNCILSDDLYKALKAAKQLIAYEEELVAHATSGASLREGRPGDAVAAGA